MRKLMSTIFICFSLNYVNAQNIIHEKIFVESGVTNNMIYSFFADEFFGYDDTNLKIKKTVNDPIPLIYNLDINYSLGENYAVGFRLMSMTGGAYSEKNAFRLESIKLDGENQAAVTLTDLSRSGYGLNLYCSSQGMVMPFSSKLGFHISMLNTKANFDVFESKYSYSTSED